MTDPDTTLHAVILDVDGTLADTERHGHRVAYNQAFEELGTDWQWTESFYGDLLDVDGGMERLGHYLRTYQPGFAPSEGIDRFVGDVHARKNAHYHAMLGNGQVPLRPGVRRLIRECHDAGLRLAIASSSLRANVHALLTRMIDADAESWFEAIVTGDDISRKKPSPEVYERVLERLALTPGQCIAIEDSGNGCRAAVTAGVPTIVTTSSYTSEHAFDGAILVADSLGEPDTPWRVARGDTGGATYLDAQGLRRQHALALS